MTKQRRRHDGFRHSAPVPSAPAQPALAPLTTPALAPADIKPDPDGLGQRFMAAFNEIENTVRDASGSSHDSFAVLSRAYFTKRGLAVHLDALGDFIDLRNTLAHGRHFRSGLLATPAPEVVAQVEALRDLVIRPPRALEVLTRSSVATCHPDQQLDDVLPLIAENGYSQIPVYSGTTYVGLLSNYAIARWLAAAWRSADGVASVPVRTVLEYASPAQQAAVMNQSCTVPEVVGALTGGAGQRRVPAVLITADGRATSPPLSIATDGDLPRLVATLRLG